MFKGKFWFLSSIGITFAFIPKAYAYATTKTDEILNFFEFIFRIYSCEIYALINSPRNFYAEKCQFLPMQTEVHNFTSPNLFERYPFILYSLSIIIGLIIGLRILIFIISFIVGIIAWIFKKKSK